MEWKIEQQHEGMLLRDYLRQVQGFSRRILKTIKFDGGLILVNGIEQSVRYALATGDKVKIELPIEKRGNLMVPENIPLSIVYEDNDIIVIDKPPGIAVIPSYHYPEGTIANGLLAHYEKHNSTYTVHIVTRLDKDTSGLMLVAKHRYSHSILSALQQAGAVNRKYQAIVEGSLSKPSGTIDAPIGRKADSIIEREIRSDGKRAITHYHVERDLEAYSFINVQLETGRTHQIRVHFSGIGHPLCGDTLYGGSLNIIQRQALHCYSLSLPHPMTKQILHFSAKLPMDMVTALQKL
ncbi:RluA family pseudouridine synthase [Virgibacillus pantothenticus]|uniref:RluA family pseudouridine synthase n=1 Tax=Virgibacillus pantothenticus TaxID=1473 RepID=UPI0009866DBB|nr:RluA family pseudouridine synthase [Virgibacillus pantothenticus]